MIIVAFTIFVTVIKGYKRIELCKQVNEAQAYQFQEKNKGAKLRSEVFDADSDTIIVDNSANCKIWRHEKNFVQNTYVKFDPKKACGVTSLVGNGSPVGIGDLNLGWRDNNGHNHKFLKPKVFHIPDSPVNISGLSAISKAIGDFQKKGTRINLSGLDSVFTWDDGKYSKTFTHSEANIPEMTVNDGYAAFHRFCDFIQKINPVAATQCYHTRVPPKNKIGIEATYDYGEEVIYKNADHVERGVIEIIAVDGTNKNVLYDLKFRDDRRITTNKDHVFATDETDVSILPNDAEDFVHQAKYLTAEEL